MSALLLQNFKLDDVMLPCGLESHNFSAEWNATKN
jgi:hypothetical protein